MDGVENGTAIFSRDQGSRRAGREVHVELAAAWESDGGDLEDRGAKECLDLGTTALSVRHSAIVWPCQKNIFSYWSTCRTGHTFSYQWYTFTHLNTFSYQGMARWHSPLQVKLRAKWHDSLKWLLDGRHMSGRTGP